ncbi:MAG: hypothetical protein ACKVOG_08270 [Rhodoglobus sp.]
MAAAPPSLPQPETEHRFPVFVAAAIALTLFAMLPSEVQFLPNWLVPSIAAVVLIPLIAINPRRLNNETRWSRWIGIGFALGLTAVNQVYVVLLVIELISGQARGPIVLITALYVWITNIIAFSLVYWELDRGGPVARRVEGVNDNARQDFRFPQQDNPAGVEGWQTAYPDYAYLSMTNMMAFSPTDAMPLTIRAKGLMAYQAFTGFVLLALVISRAVNILT